MAKQVRQFRYYKNGSNNNYHPDGIKITLATLVSGSTFASYVPIVQLGIQALPGTKFYLNSSNHPIIIGNTGIYELDILGLAEINSLQFDAKSINNISSNENAYLIVDITYEDGEG